MNKITTVIFILTKTHPLTHPPTHPVPAGPGINDNGSGSAANLEMAIQLATSSLTPRNRVTFAWWGAEEVGLVSAERGERGKKDRETEKE